LSNASHEHSAAPIVRRERDLLQVQALDQFTEDLNNAAHREVCIRTHGMAMAPQWERGGDATEVHAQVLDDMAPQ
jgi:hypothetical protein